jgi:aspartate racemase
MIGILGGMGPLATADFYKKLIARTPATCDQDHIPVVIYAVPQIPDRSTALVAEGASPLPALMVGVRALVGAGAEAIAIPCYTAHAWYGELAAVSPVPILHIVDAVAKAAEFVIAPPARLGLIATAGALADDSCTKRLLEHGYECVGPTELEMHELVTPAIARVKAGDVEPAGPLLERAVAALLDRGVAAVILGCTEVPVALDLVASSLRARCVDATAALAAACVDFYVCRRDRGVGRLSTERY